MTIDDEDRPQTAGRPTWRDAPNIVLPSLSLSPQGPGVWLVQFMFPSQYGPGAFSWVGRALEQGPELEAFLTDWFESPEDAVVKYFALEPPKGRVWTIPKAPEVAGEIVIDGTLEDLGL